MELNFLCEAIPSNTFPTIQNIDYKIIVPIWKNKNRNSIEMSPQDTVVLYNFSHIVSKSTLPVLLVPRTVERIQQMTERAVQACYKSGERRTSKN
jgi:hypothetical protein